MSKHITEFYGGEVKILFDPKSHAFYNIETGCKLISVTEACDVIDKPALKRWAVNVMRDELIARAKTGRLSIPDILDASNTWNVIRRTAADKGKIAHAWFEDYIGEKIKGVKRIIPIMPEDEEVCNGVMAFLKWERENKVKWVASERKIYSRAHDYVGILDAKAKLRGKYLSLIDFKTGSGIYNEMRYQTAAYQKADQEELGEEYTDERWVLRFDKKTAEFEARAFEEVDDDFGAFLGALAIKKRQYQLEGINDKAKKPVLLKY
jgi:hypothetical protein